MDEGMTGGAAPAAGTSETAPAASGAPSGGAETSGSAPAAVAGSAQGAAPGGSGQPGTAPARTTEELIEIMANGKPVKLTQTELRRRAAMGIGAEERLRKAAETERQYKEMQDRMAEYEKLPPAELLRKRGLDPNAWAEQVLAEALADSNLSPEAIQLRETQAKLAEYEARQEREQRQASEAERTGHIDRILQARVAEANELLDSDPFLGSSKEHRGALIDEIGQTLHAAYLEGSQNGDIGLMNMSTAHALTFVRARRQSEARNLLSGFKDDGSMLDFMGDEFIGRIRKADASRMDAKAKTATPAAPLPKRPEEMTVSEMLEARALANKRG